MLLNERTDMVSALTTDYLYGKMVNVRQASYLIESDIKPCCTPSVLSFASEEDTRRFQKGFGGMVMDYQQAILAVQEMMSISAR